MAAGFKTATVASGDVPATLTSYPSYVDLSRLGITTLAEAQSVRVYADSGKTTEWAREIVSATEMHVKIPSLTSTTSVYVDWDGVRADYAATDTYGRNAVWSDYELVMHMTDNTTSTVLNAADGLSMSKLSAGNPSEVAGKIGEAQFNDDTNAAGGTDYIVSDDASLDNIGNGDTTIQTWFKALSSGQLTNGFLFSKDMGTNRVGLRILTTGKVAESYFYDGNFPAAAGTTDIVTTPAWYLLHAVRDATVTNKIYVNGTQENSVTDTTASDLTSTSKVVIFGRSSDYLDATNGYIDELRVRQTALSANWITTEYNNQSDEAGFWGTWSDVGGATDTTKFFLMM